MDLSERTYIPPNLRIPTLGGYLYDVTMKSGQVFTVTAESAEEAMWIANDSMRHTTATSANYTPRERI